MTAAVELAVKGHEVTVFETGPRLLHQTRVSCEDAVATDLAVLDKLEIEVRLNSPQSEFKSAGEFDAVYVPAGIPDDPATMATSQRGLFAGGETADVSAIQAAQNGKCAAISIDRFLQGASLAAGREAFGPATTRIYMDTRGIAPTRAVEPADPARYSRDEAIREAGRCFPCGCMECVKVCEYLAHYKSYPKRYVRDIYNNDCIVLGVHPANQMVNSCTLCGLCAEVCPEKLNMAEVCMEARESLTAKGKMPPSAHEFALRDMDFSTSDAFRLVRQQPGFTSSAAVFFPGCQLSGSSPGHVARIYQHLTQTVAGGVGLMLGCCGAPAHWSARSERFAGILRQVKEDWAQLGNPRLINACSSCFRTFRDSVPEIPAESLWNVLDVSALPEPLGAGGRWQSTILAPHAASSRCRMPLAACSPN